MTLQASVVMSPMTRDEAEHHTAQAKYHAGKLREHIAAIHDREGWRALAYPSFEAWAEAELQQGYKWALKLRNAHVIQQQIEAHIEGALPAATLPTKHAEQLHKLDGPEAQAQAYQRAMNLAEAEGGKVATRHVQRAVQVALDEAAVRGGGYAVVRHLMESGEITAAVARQMNKALDEVHPGGCAYVLHLIGRHGLSDPALVPRLAALDKRPESKMLEEIRTGYLDGVPLAKATLTNWGAAAEEARKAHVAEKTSEKDEQQAVEARIVTVYRSKDPARPVPAAAEKTLAALRRELGEDDMMSLYNLMEAAIG